MGESGRDRVADRHVASLPVTKEDVGFVPSITDEPPPSYRLRFGTSTGPTPDGKTNRKYHNETHSSGQSSANGTLTVAK